MTDVAATPDETATPDVAPYTVLKAVQIPHCDGADCGAEECLQPTGAYHLPGGQVSLVTGGLDPEQEAQMTEMGLYRPVGVYDPGQTVHLTEAQAEPMIADGSIAPAGATVVAEFRVA